MSNILGRLVVRLAAETLQYKADLKTAAKDTVDAAKDIEKGTQAATSTVGKLGDALGNAGKVAGAASGDLAGAAEGAQALAAGASVAALAVGAVVVVAAAAAFAASEGAKEQRGYDKALIQTGNSAGVTGGQIQTMARDIGRSVGTQYEAAAALTALAASGRVAGSDLQTLGEVALQSQRVLGISVEETVKQFAELGAEPVRASEKLNQTTNYLTASVYAQIKAAEKLGDTDRAGSIAQNAYAEATRTRTEQVRQGLGTLALAWISVGDVAKKAWDYMLNLGREQRPEQVLEAQRKALADLEAQFEKGGSAAPGLERRIALQKVLIEAQKEEVRNGQRAAQAQGENAAAQKASVAAIDALDKANEKALTNQERATKALGEYRESLAALRKTDPTDPRLAPEQIRKTEAAIIASGQAAKKAASDYVYGRDAAKAYADVFLDLTRLRDQATAKTENLSKAEERYRDYLASPVYAEHSQAIRDIVAGRAAEAIAAEEQAKATEAATKATSAALEVELKRVEALEKALPGLADQNQKLREEIELIGLSDAAQQGVLQTRLAGVIALKEERLARLQNTEFLGREQIALEEEIRLLKERLALQGKKFDRTTEAKAFDEALKNQVSDLNSVSEAGRKVFTDVGNSGVNAFKRIGDTLKTSVLDLLYNATARPFIIQIAGSLTGASASAIAQAQGGSSLGGLGGLGNLLGAGNNFATSIGSSFATTLADVLPASLSSSLGLTSSSLLASNAALAGGGASGAAAASAAAAAGNGAAASSLLAGVSAAAPYVAVGLLVLSELTKSKGGPKAGGRYGPAELEGGALDGTAQQIGQTLQKQYENLTRLLGGTNSVTFGAALSRDPKGTAPNFAQIRALQNGNQLFNSIDLNAGRTDETLAQAFSKLAGDGLLAGLQASNIADKFRVYLDQYVSAGLSGETAASNLTILAAGDAAFKVLGRSIAGLADLSLHAQQQIINQTGGLDSLGSKLASYQQNFVSDTERTAIATRNLAADFAAIGVAVPASREDFKALVDQQIAAGDAGTGLLSSLINLSGEFAAVVPPTLAASAAEAGRSLQTINDSLKSLKSAGEQLDVDLLRAQGQGTAADFAQRDLNIKGFTTPEIAAYDQNQEKRDQITRLNQASAAAEAAAGVLAGIQTELNGLTDTLEQARQREIDKLDPASAALKRLVFARQDEIAAANVLAGIQTELNGLTDTLEQARQREIDKLDPASAALKRLVFARQDEIAAANVLAGIQTELNGLTDTLEQARQREIDKLDPASAALKRLVFARQDEIAATNRAAAVASERYGLETEYLTLVGDQDALRQRELDKLDPSNRALKESIYRRQDEKTAAEAAAAAITKAQDSARTASEKAYAALERSAGAQRTAAQASVQQARDTISAVDGIFKTLASNVRDLYGEVDSTRLQGAAEGRSFVADALARAQAGGGLPDGEALTAAIAAARNGTRAGASQFEQDRDRLVLAGQLSQLKAVAGTQLTEAQQTLQVAETELQRIDDLLATNKAQLDALSGIDGRILTETEAINNLAAAFAAQRTANAAISAASASSAAAVAGGGSGADPFGAVNAAYQFDAGGVATGRQYLDLLAESARLTGFDDVQAYDRLINPNSAGARTDLLQALRDQGVPGFANGGDHFGGIRLVGENGPELEATGAARYFDARTTRGILNGGGGGGSSPAEAQQMRAELRQMRAEQQQTNRLLASIAAAAERDKRVPQRVAVVS